MDPTVIIGVGQAGINVLSTIDSMVSEDDDEMVRYIAMDSDEESLDKVAPSDAGKMLFSTSSDFFKEDLHKYPYLTQEMTLPERGTRRQRPLGRYKLDNFGIPEFEDLFADLKEEIVGHFEATSVGLSPLNSFNIVLVHSMGGGTGSGTYPLLLGMLNEITDGLPDEGATTYVAGVGVVSELPSGNTPPSPETYYPNAYAALSDLDKLTDIRKQKESLELPIYGSPPGDNRETVQAFELLEVPFDDYWLVGVDEEEMVGVADTQRPESYRASQNKAIARSVSAICDTDTVLEDWTASTPVTGTFEQTEVTVPHEAVQELAQRYEERSRLRDRINEEIPMELDSLQTRRDEFERLKRSFEVDDSALQETVRETMEDEFSSSEDLFETATPEDIDEFLDGIDEHYGFEGIIVATNVLKERELDDSFQAVEEDMRAVVEELWAKYELDAQPRYPGGTFQTKAAGLEDFFESEIDKYAEVVDDWEPSGIERLQDAVPPLTPPLESDREAAERALETLRADYEELQRVESVWTKGNHLGETLIEWQSGVRQRLDNHIAECENEMTEILNEREKLEADLDALKREIQALRTDLTEPSSSERLGVLPIRDDRLDDIDIETVENDLVSLGDYVDRGFVAEEDIHYAMNDAQTLCTAWDANIVRRDFSKTEETRTFQDVNELWIRFGEANDHLRDFITTDALRANTMASGSGLDYLDDQFRIEYISFTRRGPIAAFEYYQRLDEKADSGRLELMAEQYEDFRHAFAYPEWYGRELLRTFGGHQITLERPPEMDPTSLDKPEMSEDELKNYVVSSALEAYLWEGADIEDYGALEMQEFSGWKKELSEDSITFTDLQEAAPPVELKRKWLADQADWEDIVVAYSENIAEQMDVEVQIN